LSYDEKIKITKAISSYEGKTLNNKRRQKFHRTFYKKLDEIMQKIHNAPILEEAKQWANVVAYVEDKCIAGMKGSKAGDHLEVLGGRNKNLKFLEEVLDWEFLNKIVIHMALCNKALGTTTTQSIEEKMCLTRLVEILCAFTCASNGEEFVIKFFNTKLASTLILYICTDYEEKFHIIPDLHIWFVRLISTMGNFKRGKRRLKKFKVELSSLLRVVAKIVKKDGKKYKNTTSQHEKSYYTQNVHCYFTLLHFQKHFTSEFVVSLIEHLDQTFGICYNLARPIFPTIGLLFVELFRYIQPKIDCSHPVIENIIFQIEDRSFWEEDYREQHNIRLLQSPHQKTKISCGFCSKLESRNKLFKKCSACNEIYYCSKKCQKKHWSIHKKSCQQN
jgi:hypothetical protein